MLFSKNLRLNIHTTISIMYSNTTCTALLKLASKKMRCPTKRIFNFERLSQQSRIMTKFLFTAFGVWCNTRPILFFSCMPHSAAGRYVRHCTRKVMLRQSKPHFVRKLEMNLYGTNTPTSSCYTTWKNVPISQTHTFRVPEITLSVSCRFIQQTQQLLI
jgi:hypothetical protein